MAFGGIGKLIGRSGCALRASATMDLSVIVAFHNCGSYLRECLDSLAAQTYEGSWEVLLVDDGSTDGSARIAQEFASESSRFRLLSQRAAGVSAARNLGLSQARGRFVAFVNGTDKVVPDLYQNMMAAALRQKADLVLCDVARVDSQGLTSNSNLHRLAFRNMPRCTTFADFPSLIYDCTLFNKVISRQLCQDAQLSFSENTDCADLLPALKLHFRAKRICLYPEVGYLWQAGVADCYVEQRPKGVDEFQDRVKALQSCYDFGCNHGMSGEQFRMLDVKVLEHDLMMVVNSLDGMDPDAAHGRMAQIRDLIKKWTLFDEYPMRSTLVCQKYAYVEADDLESLCRLLDWQRKYYQSARVTVARTRGLRVAIPADLITIGRFGITQDIRRWPPMCKLVSVEQQEDNVLIHGFVYKRRTFVPEESQRVRAYLVNARTGKEMEVMAVSEVCRNAVRLYGRILEEQSGRKRRYETEGAGFCLSISLAALAADPQMQGLNFVRVNYANPFERGSVYMRRVRQASRDEIVSTVYSGQGVDLRIQMGPVDQTRILVAPSEERHVDQAQDR